MNRKLTLAVYEGLVSLAAFVEASGPDDITGCNEEQMEHFPNQREIWQNVLRAVAWIRTLEPPKR